MCMPKAPKQQAATTPAAAPAPPIAPADAPEVGDTRRRQNVDLYGDDAPNYRVKRTTGVPTVNPNSPITM